MATLTQEFSRADRSIDIAQTQLARTNSYDGKVFWRIRLEAEQTHKQNIITGVGGQAVINTFATHGTLDTLPEAIDLTYAANEAYEHVEKAKALRREIQEVDDLMALVGSIHPGHPGLVNMQQGNHKRESDAAHHMSLFERRVLEAADLYPPLEVRSIEDASIIAADQLPIAVQNHVLQPIR